MFKLVVLSALLAVAASHVAVSGVGAPLAYSGIGAPLAYSGIGAPLAYSNIAHAPLAYAAAPAVSTYSVPSVAISHQITKNVHYASQPVVTGYSSQILKPNLGALATPLNTVTQERVLAPARTVATITPQITQVQPELTVRQVPVDVPVHQPYVSEVEVRQSAPIITAPVVKTVAPLVQQRLIATPYAAGWNHNIVAPVAGVHSTVW